MLRIEGLNWLDIRDLAHRPLADGDPLTGCVLVPAIDLSDADATRLASHVHAGGRLLTARPGDALATALGFGPPIPIWRESLWRYVLLDESHPAAAGLLW